MRDGFEFDEDFVKGAAFVEPSHTQRSRKRRRWRRAALTVMAVLVGAGVATGGVLWVTRDVDDTPPVAAPSGSKDATRPSAPGDPFAGSPAESYAVGAAGIVVPKATAVGGVPAKQVAGAYARAKRMLVAAGLDRKALLGGAPDAFAGTLDPRKRTSFRKRLRPHAARDTGWSPSRHAASSCTAKRSKCTAACRPGPPAAAASGASM